MREKANRSLLTFFSFIFVSITLFGIYFLWNIEKFVRRGIDLVGGSYITLDVAIDVLCKETLQEVQKKTESFAKEKGYALKKSSIAAGVLSIVPVNVAHISALMTQCKAESPELVIASNNEAITISFSEAAKNIITKNAIVANIKALRNRLDPFGAGEILIAQQGEKIVIELPSVKDVAHAKELIGRTALLTIRPVIDQGRDREKLEEEYGEYKGEVVILPSAEEKGIWYVLPEHATVTGALLKDAFFGYDPRGGNASVVHFVFNTVGGKKFRALTEENIGKQLAIAIDDQVISAPHVNEPIGAEGIISGGGFTPQSAQELALLLKSGAFAAPVKYAEERVIEPLLGKKTVHQGLIACLIGMFLLLVASLLVYKVAGGIAFLVLLYNLLFSLIGIWLIGGVLTLSGMAGLLLTVGMAIDSSILIFEKMREELAHGVEFRLAMENGFRGAMAIIIDANVTHFLVALVLYYVGAGPLKGFAISMIVGIIATIITGIIFMKSVFRYLLSDIGIKRIRI